MAEIKTIVLIDDDTDLGDLVKSNLSSKYDLKYFEEPSKALQFVRNHPVAAVILDYYLKDMSGLLVAWELIEQHPLTPILLISADELVVDKIKELNFRHVSFLPKPFQGSDLLSAIARIQKITLFEEVRPT